MEHYPFSSNQSTGFYWSKEVVLIWVLPVLTILITIITIIIRSNSSNDSPTVDTTSNPLTAPSPSSSSLASSWDVFLSFHGEDTRGNFTAHLYKALHDAGIRTFMNEPELRMGEEISVRLRNAIRGSKMCAVVLSENFAYSKWCLNELVEILDCERKKGQVVVPVFYYVNPSDVCRQRNGFMRGLHSQKNTHPVEMIQKWERALAAVGKLKGHHVRKDANKNEADVVQEIVKNAELLQASVKVHKEEYLVVVDSAVEEIYQKLQMDSNDVRAIGICGMGGIGKTTIAKAFYNNYSNKFNISCFIENVKQNSQGAPLLWLLEQLLVKLLRKNDCRVTDVESGIRQLKQIICSNKALIVLDDLDQSCPSELQITLCKLSSPGSRIIFTTRDTNVINQLRVDVPEIDMYTVKKLGQNDSLELFSCHAFRKSMTPEIFRELSVRFVTHAGGLPLALKVLGSSLRGRNLVSFWKDKLKQVQKIPMHQIQDILQLSYDELEDETEKAMFLDIAFFFVGKDKDDVVHIFKSCGYFPGVGIPNLVDRCLLTINKDNKFEMHNLIQDMGRELGKTTHLFLRGNAWKDLQNLEERNIVEGLILDLTTSTERQMSTAIFERMSNLRLLQIIDADDIVGSFENLLSHLRCIRWHHCPMKYLPSTFRPQNLVYIDMPFSEFKLLWKGPMPVKQLNNLGLLNLRCCRNLKRLPEQLGDMRGLKIIDVSHTAIEKLPDSITHLYKLFTLDLSYCKSLRGLPEQLGDLKGLKKFDARDTAIKQLPDSITHIKELAELYVSNCKNLRKLPEQFGNMEGLRHLSVISAAIEQLPDSITHLKELVELDMSGCKNLRKLPEQFGNLEGLQWFSASATAIEQLPDSFAGLIDLVELQLSDCKNLTSLPNTMWKLKFLKILNVSKNPKLKRLPDRLEKMQCLEELYAGCTPIEEIPDSIGLLTGLQELSLACKKLRYVPESIWNLTSLNNLFLLPGDVGRTNITNLPESVKYIRKLKTLSLSCNIRLCLPMVLCFTSLQRLTLIDEGKNFSSVKPFSLSKLFNLQHLTLENCRTLGSTLPELPLNLGELNVSDHTLLEQLPDLSSLRKLKSLCIQRCINLRSIWLLPTHLSSLSVHKCASLQDLPDLSMLKELRGLSFTECSNLKFILLKESCVQVQPHDYYSFTADLPNREISDWFAYRSSGHTVSFDILLSLGDNCLHLALWVVYKCKSFCQDSLYRPYIRAVATNYTKRITQHYNIYIQAVVGEEQSSVQCIKGKDTSMESGDRIKVSFQSLMYVKDEVVGKVKVKMCGAHVRPSTYY